jgi:HAD superfamily hydrolase (TIGR01484 family)
MAMLSIDALTREECLPVRGVLFDIDDTFTLEGRLIAEAFSALWEMHDRGLKLVPITGRPAGWCDHIARMWPVDGVVGENGAFYYWYDRKAGKLRHRYIFSPAEMQVNRGKLEAIRDEVLRRVPGARLSADQPYRIFDLAIDFNEDVPRLREEEVEEICRIFREHGASYKISSIHVNGWFGDYNKLSTAKLFLQERFNQPWPGASGAFIFAGDSPNDEPMFEALKLTVGVANVREFAGSMKHLPKYVTHKSGGLGFAEMAAKILQLKG